ncbi:hypothetical protein D3C77_751310 [compost metagenome]
MRAGVQLAERRLEEIAQGDQLLGTLQVAGIEYQRLECRRVRGIPGRQGQAFATAIEFVAQSLQCRQRLLDQRPAADQQRALHRT